MSQNKTLNFLDKEKDMSNDLLEDDEIPTSRLIGIKKPDNSIVKNLTKEEREYIEEYGGEEETKVVTVKEEDYSPTGINSSTKLYEKINEYKLRYIYTHFDEINEKTNIEGKKDRHKKYGGMKTILGKLVKKCKGGYIPVTYFQNNNQGRFFARGSLSLQGTARKIRQTISQEYLLDYDLANAHPRLLGHYCKINNIPCVNLSNYIENRETYYRKLMDHSKISRGEAKTTFLKVINGGILGNDGSYYSDTICDFYNELITIREKIVSLNPTIAKNLKRRKNTGFPNIPGRVTNHVMCDLENQVLMCMYDFFKKRKIKVSVLVFDGIMIQKDSIKEDEINTISKDISEYIKSKMGIDIDVVHKPMEDILDIPEMSVADKEKQDDLFSKLQTQEELAKVISDHIKEDKNIYYFKNGKTIFVFNESNKLYEEFEFSKIITLISSYILPIFKSFDFDLFDYETVKEVNKMIKNVQTTNYQQGIVTHLKHRLIDSSEFIEKTFNNIPHLLPISDNKVINFKTLELEDREKHHYFTFTTDNIFKPKREGQEKIDKYIREILMTENPKFVKCFMTITAYFLTGENFLKIFPIFSGSGNNGKSVFFNLFKSVIGKFAVVANEKVFLKTKSQSVHSDEYIRLIGKRFSYLTEIDKDSEFNEKLIKSITGNDGDISLRGCGGRTFETKLTCKLLAICNSDDTPTFKDKQGFANRVQVFPFKNTFKKDRNKVTEIMAMKDDFFTELCYYCFEFYENGFDFELSDEVKNATTAYKYEVDTVQQFFDENICITRKERDRVSKKELIRHYIDFCKDNGIKGLSRTKFYTQVQQMFNLEVFRRTHFKGISLISEGGVPDILDITRIL